MTISFTFPMLTRDDVYRVETPHLWLRWSRFEDAAVMAKWVGLPEVAEMTSSFPVGMSAAEVAERLERQRESNAAGKASGICDRSEARQARGDRHDRCRLPGGRRAGVGLSPQSGLLGPGADDRSCACDNGASVRTE